MCLTWLTVTFVIADQSVLLIANSSNLHTARSNVTVLQKCIVPPCSELEIEA